jgi:hypothetical protein
MFSKLSKFRYTCSFFSSYLGGLWGPHFKLACVEKSLNWVSSSTSNYLSLSLIVKAVYENLGFSFGIFMSW